MASKLVLCDLDFAGNIIKRVCVENVPTDPTTEKNVGRIVLVGGAELKYYNGNTWISLAAASSVTAISNRVTNLENTVGSSTSGLVKDVADLKKTIDILLGDQSGSIIDTINKAIEGKQDRFYAGDALTFAPPVGSDPMPFLHVQKSNGLGNILSIHNDGLYVPTPPPYRLMKTGNDPATYQLLVDDDLIPGSDPITIPKDMVVTGGEVRAATSADKANDPSVIVGDLYIVLTVANSASTKLYIPAKGLVDVYNGDKLFITVDPNTNTIALDIDAVRRNIDEALRPVYRYKPEIFEHMDAHDKEIHNLSMRPDASDTKGYDAANRNYVQGRKQEAINTIRSTEDKYTDLRKVGDYFRMLSLSINLPYLRRLADTVDIREGAMRVGLESEEVLGVISYTATLYNSGDVTEKEIEVCLVQHADKSYWLEWNSAGFDFNKNWRVTAEFLYRVSSPVI